MSCPIKRLRFKEDPEVKGDDIMEERSAVHYEKGFTRTRKLRNISLVCFTSVSLSLSCIPAVLGLDKNDENVTADINVGDI